MRPLNLDTTSSKRYVYVRENIVESEETDPVTGEKHTVFRYDETKIDKTEYYQQKSKELSAEVAVLRADNDELRQQISEQADALIELASIIG